MSVPPPPPSVAASYDDAPSPQRETMLTMRERILAVVPDATEIMKYAMPTFVLDGTDVCGLLPHKGHVGYYPYSGSVLEGFPDLVSTYGGTKGALHVPVDQPLPQETITRLVQARLAPGH